MNPNCDGSGPHTPGEIRLYPLGGGGNLILCANCWNKENRYRWRRAVETGAPENWPQEDWQAAKVVYDSVGNSVD